MILQQLWNRFRVVPDELNFPPLLSAVHEVDMSANVLEAVPKWMDVAASLQYLNLGNNREDGNSVGFIAMKFGPNINPKTSPK